MIPSWFQFGSDELRQFDGRLKVLLLAGGWWWLFREIHKTQAQPWMSGSVGNCLQPTSYTQRLKDRRYSWNYWRARLLFETAWNLPPADGKIEAIAFWDAQARNIFYLNGNWKNSTKPMLFFEFWSKPVITSVGNGQRLCTVVQKRRKPCIFNISSTSDPIFDNPWEWSFSKRASWSIASK